MLCWIWVFINNMQQTIKHQGTIALFLWYYHIIHMILSGASVYTLYNQNAPPLGKISCGRLWIFILYYKNEFMKYWNVKNRKKWRNFGLSKFRYFYVDKFMVCPRRHIVKKNILLSQWNIKLIIYNLQSIYQDNEKVF